MSHNPDPYYDRPEVSNSDLTSLKEILHPRPITGDRERAFRFGTLVDALITEPGASTSTGAPSTTSPTLTPSLTKA